MKIRLSSRTALRVIANRPPLVFAGEARDLQEKLANAAAGNAFVSVRW